MMMMIHTLHHYYWSNHINISYIIWRRYILGAKSLAKKAHDKRSKVNPALDIKADSKTSSSTTDSPAGSKNAATYDSDHKGSSLSPSLATDDKYSHKWWWKCS